MTAGEAMDGFLDGLLARMSLAEKVGQLNYPHGAGVDTTGVGGTVDPAEMTRRGQLCGISVGANVGERRSLQKIAVDDGPNGIPLFFGKDCIQRYRTGGPIPLGLSCSWDLDLIARVNAMCAREARADGININWAPMLDICYDARWGRIAEGNGEFPWLGARIAETIVRAYQGADGDMARPDRFMATLKHFAAYGLAQAGRDYAGVEASVATLYRVMEPFRAGVAAGAGAIMVAFNTINDIPATAHPELLWDVLRRRFGFDGIIVTDFTAIDPELINHGVAETAREAAYLAFKAGVNVDLVSQAFLRFLPGLVAEGAADPDAFMQAEGPFRFGPVTEAEVTARCRQVLAAKYRLGLFHDPYLGMDGALRDRVTLTPQNRALVREAAAGSAVLLKNDAQTLPLAPENGIVAVIGPLAQDRIDMQGTWAIDVNPADSVTVLEAVRGALGNPAKLLHAKGSNITDDPLQALRLNIHNRETPSVILGPASPEAMLEDACAMAHAADTIILCLGEAKEHSGESSTRDDIRLPPAQRRLFRAMADVAERAGKRLVTLVISGRPLALPEEAARSDALIWSGHPGIEGGHGLADLIFGRAEPRGRLSFAMPRSTGQLPYRSEDLPTGRPQWGIGVDLDGDTEKDRNGCLSFRKFTTACIIEGSHAPLFPAGFGLGYTEFAHGPLRATRTELAGEDDVLDLALDITNTGSRAGTETVQLYLRDIAGSTSRPVRELRGFERVTLAPGETREVRFAVTTDALRFPKGATLRDCVTDWEPGAFDAMVGPDCERVQSLRFHWKK